MSWNRRKKHDPKVVEACWVKGKELTHLIDLFDLKWGFRRARVEVPPEYVLHFEMEAAAFNKSLRYNEIAKLDWQLPKIINALRQIGEYMTAKGLKPLPDFGDLQELLGVFPGTRIYNVTTQTETKPVLS